LRDWNFVQIQVMDQIKFKLGVAGRLHLGAERPDWNRPTPVAAETPFAVDRR
jgi:hypothetical protein